MTASRAEKISLARSALTRGDSVTTQRLSTALVTDNPSDAAGHFMLGLAESDMGHIQAGITHVGRAVALDPKGEYRAQLARLFTLARRDGDAAATLREAEQALPDDALSRDTMGCVYARLGDHEAALPHFTEAVRLAPDNMNFRYNQATTLNFLGRTAEAETALEYMITLDPDDASAHHLLSGLRRQSPENNHIDRLTHIYNRAHDSRDRLLLGYALSKELEDTGQPREALNRLCAVNNEHRQNLSYSFTRDKAVFDAVEESWISLSRVKQNQVPPDAPIFIIGMPRTGTTLVDRIISSHSDVESAGELQAMPLAVKKEAGTRSRMVMDPETLLRAAQEDISAIGRDYLYRASHHRRDASLRFTDKFPGNFHYVGFIARALPTASIICLRRHPMDTVLSNFRNLFAVSSRYYDYSYNLLDIAAYYVCFDRLMAFWRAALPGRILEIHYEDLVADQEGETRRLLAHCNLEWDDACLSFHANNAPVSTPSAAQVRRPIYRDSIDRWKQHIDILAPVMRFFEDHGINPDPDRKEMLHEHS